MVVSIADFHRRLEPEHLSARFVRRWTELPAEHADHPDVLDIPEALVRATGVSIEEFITAAVLLHSASLVAGPRLPRDLLTWGGLSPEASTRILELVVTTIPDLRAWAQNNASASMWEFHRLSQFPLIDDGENLIAIRPLLVLDRFFGWLPYFDVWTRMTKSEQGRFRTCLGRLGEFYALETLRAQAERRGYRLAEEQELREALRPTGTSGRTCDLAIGDGRRWALFEITSSQLTRGSVTSTSAEALHADLDKLVGKIEQLDHTIIALRTHEDRLTGVPPHRRRHFHPVLVLTEGFPVNPVTVTMLRQRAEEADYLAGSDVAELQVVDVVELEIIEGAGFGEPGLLDLLEAKQHSTMERTSLRDFLVLDHQIRSSTPPRVSALADKARRIARSFAPPRDDTAS